jgi:8-oxo-dGTP diphosphatase
MIFLVRHAKAGHRDPAVEDDSLRPLTKGGWAQATAMVEPLTRAGAGSVLLSSPYLRCMQSLEPLGAHLGLKVQGDDRLIEGEPFEPVLDLLRETPDGSVLCSHGDLIPDVVAALERRNCTITTVANWKKGAIWLLERTSTLAIVSAGAWPPFA